MEMNNRTVLILLSIIMLAGLVFSFIAPLNFNNEAQFQNLADYLYNSPILKSYRPYFSLGGKKIIDLTVNEKKVKTVTENKTIVKPPIPPIGTPVPTATAIAVAKPKATDKVTSPGGVTTPGLTVRLNPNTKDKNSDWTNSEPIAIGNNQAPISPYQNMDRDISDWKYKLSQSPTKENMNSFVKALSQGTVTSAIFYAVINSLLDENNEIIQRIALYGLAATPSIESYNLLASKSNDTFLKGNNLAYDHEILDYYNQTSMLPILLQALRNANDNVILEALHNISSINNNPQPDLSNPVHPSGNRLRRGTLTTSFNTANLKNLLNELSLLAHSHNPQIVFNSELLMQHLESKTNLQTNNTESQITPINAL